MIREEFRAILLGILAVAILGAVPLRAALWAQAAPPDPAIKPEVMPELTFSVNGSGKVTITPGTALVFELRLRNGAAARSGWAAAREQLKEETEERVQAGKLTRQEAEVLPKKKPAPPSVPAIILTLGSAGFSFKGAGSQDSTTLPWQPKVAAPVAPASVTLDAHEIASATFVVAPEQTASASKGTYILQAHFENRAPGQWQGTIASNPVEITVAEEPRAATADDLKEKHLLTAEYLLAIKDYDRAIAVVQQVFAIAPQSIDGMVLLGQAHEGKGDFRAALDAYEKAYREFRKRYPRVHPHPPRALTWDIQRMQEELGMKRPGVEGPAAPAPASLPATPPPAQSAPPPSSSPSREPAGSGPVDPKAKAMEEYEETIRSGDALFGAGDYFEAVRVYERAWRIAYNNKLKTDSAALEERLARARKARDEKKR